jgi:hypothetical protein
MFSLMKQTALLVIILNTLLTGHVVSSNTAILDPSDASNITTPAGFQSECLYLCVTNEYQSEFIFLSPVIEGRMEGKSCTCYCPSRTESNSQSSGCFASDTLVTLISHQRIPIHQLRPTDQLLTSDGKTILATQMMMMLDKNVVAQSMLTHSSLHHILSLP